MRSPQLPEYSFISGKLSAKSIYILSIRKLVERKSDLPSSMYLMLFFLLSNMKKVNMNRVSAKNLKCQYKNIMEKREYKEKNQIRSIDSEYI